MRLLLWILIAGALCKTVFSGKGGPLKDTVDIIREIRLLTKTIINTWEHVIKGIDVVQQVSTGALIYTQQQRLMEQIEDVNIKIQSIEQYNIQTAETLEKMLWQMEKNQALQQQFIQLNLLNHNINTRYNILLDYEQNHSMMEESTLQKFAEWNVSPSSFSISQQLEQLYNCLYGIDSFAPDQDYSLTLLDKLTKSFMAAPTQMCQTRQSAQQFALHMFSKTAYTELKAFSVMAFSWMVLRQLGRGNFTQEQQLMRQNHQKRMDFSRTMLQQVMSLSDRLYWRCDPEMYVEGKTFERVTRLLQGYVDNEINLNADNTCWKTCTDYNNFRSSGDISSQPNCKGRLYNCATINSDIDMCLSSENATRRYEYISSEDGSNMGNTSSSCKTKNVKASSWMRFWHMDHCDYCFCLCDEPGPKSDRYFNLRDTMSDFKANWVVTGVRFVKHRRVFHLQLLQGQLLPRGAINSSSLVWLPVEDYNVTDVDVRNDYDYHTLTMDSRALDLDEIRANATDEVVTGARFRVFKNHLNLEVRFSPFDFRTGLLIDPLTKSYWLGREKSRQMLNLENPDLPVASKMPSLPLSTDNQFMQFVSSSQAKDAAQNTVPFVDVQDVVPHPTVPLSGLGIYHKGRPGYGGFFAPKVVTYDLSEHLLDAI